MPGDDVSIPLHLVDQFSGPMDKLAAKIDDVRRKQRQFHREGELGASRMGTAFTRTNATWTAASSNFSNTGRSINSTMETIRRQQGRTLSEGESGWKRYASAFDRAAKQISKSSMGLAGFGRVLGREMQSVVNMTMRWGMVAGAAGAGGVALLIRQGIKLNNELQRSQTMLETMMGSQARAQGMMRWVFRFAEKTPFQVRELIDYTAQLEALGLNAQRWLPVVGNLSAAFGGDKERTQQIVRAVGYLKGARTGEAFEALTRVGISRLDFIKQGIQFTKGGSLKDDPEDALDALERIVNERFPGLMDRLSATFAGTLSNMLDVGENFLRDSTKGLFDAMAVDARALLNRIDAMRDDGRATLLRGRIGGALSSGYASAKAFMQTEVVDVFKSGGFGAVASNLIDQLRPHAVAFAKWFASVLADGIVGALKMIATDEGMVKLAAAYVGLRNIDALAAAGFGAVGRGAASVAGLGMRGAGRVLFGAGAAGTAGSAGAAGAAGALTTAAARQAVNVNAIAPANRLMANLFTTGGGAVAGSAAGSAGAGLLGRLGLTAAGIKAATMSTAATVGAGALAGAGLAATADSIMSTRNATDMAWWNLPGRLGRWTRNLFTGDEYHAPNHARAQAELAAMNDARMSGMDRRVRTMFEAAGPEAAMRLRDRLALPTQGRAQLRDSTLRLGEEFASLKDLLEQFGRTSNSTIDEMATRLNNQGSGLVSGFASLQDRIERITKSALPELRREAEALDVRRMGLTFDPSNPQQFGLDLNDIQRRRTRNLHAQFSSRMDLMGLEQKQHLERVNENQGVMERFLATRESGDTSHFAQLFKQGLAVRKMGDLGFGLAGLDRLLDIQNMTGMDLSSAIRPAAMNELRGILAAEFGDREADKMLQEFGPVEPMGKVFERKMDDLIAAFREQAESDAAETIATADAVKGSITTAFQDGAQQAAERIATQLGITLPQIMTSNMETMIHDIIERLNRDGEARSALQQAQGYGG